eukprot:285022_1
MAKDKKILNVVMILAITYISTCVSSNGCNYVVNRDEVYAVDVCMTIQTYSKIIYKKYVCNGYEAIEQIYSNNNCTGNVIQSFKTDNPSECGNIGRCEYMMTIKGYSVCTDRNLSQTSYSVVPLVTDYCIAVGVDSYELKCLNGVPKMKIYGYGSTTCTKRSSTFDMPGCLQTYGKDFIALYCGSIFYNKTSTIPPTTKAPTGSPTEATTGTPTTNRVIVQSDLSSNRHVLESIMIVVIFMFVF